MGFNMSGSVVGKGECLQPRGSGPGHAPPGKVFISTGCIKKSLLLEKVC